MPMEAFTNIQFSYAAGDGPTRGGVTKKKPGLQPSLLGDEGMEDFLRMAEGVCEWGEAEYGRDHGNETDHKLLLNTLTLALKLIPGAEELAAEQFGLT